MKKISIITVTYNAEKHLQQTIDSVISQDYPDIEYIIVDGMSNDGTWDIIWKNKHFFSHIIHEKDDGLYEAMNKGIAVSTGDIIGIINSDDWYNHDMFIKVVNVFNRNKDVDVVYGKMAIVNADGTYHIGKKVTPDELWYKMIPHPTVFVKKDMYLKFGIFDTRYRIVADYDLVMRLYLNRIRFYFLDEVISFFRLGGISTTNILQAAREVKEISEKNLTYAENQDYVIRRIKECYYQKVMQAFLNIDKDSFFYIVNKHCDMNNIYLWGYGDYGIKFLKKFNNTGIKIKAIIDNNLDKQGVTENGIPIIGSDMCKAFVGDLFISTIYVERIIQQLKNSEYNLNIIDIEKLVDSQ